MTTKSYSIPTSDAGERVFWMSLEFSLNRPLKKRQPTIAEVALSSGSADEALLALPSVVPPKIRKDAQLLLRPWPDGRYTDAYRRSGGILNVFTPPWGDSEDDVWAEMIAELERKTFPDDEDRQEAHRALEKQWNTTPHPLFAGLTPAQVMVGGGPQEAELAEGFLQQLTRTYDGRPFEGEGEALIKTLTLLRRWQSQSRKDGQMIQDIIVAERNELLARRARVLRELTDSCWKGQECPSRPS
ncbi:MAG: hypothetical protein PVI09_15540 [Anaerolineae bacterium]|jgi:hypothetical protein